MNDAPTEDDRLFVRAARGDGSGIISMPADMQEEVRNTVLDYWTEWSVSYLLKCGHHRDELVMVESSLRDVLAQWRDARNSFDTPGDDPQFFDEGKEWNVFWKPSTETVAGPETDREFRIWEDGHTQGWHDCLHDLRFRKPNLLNRIMKIIWRRR